MNVFREQQTAVAYTTQSDQPSKSEYPQQAPISRRSMLQPIKVFVVDNDIEEVRSESFSSDMTSQDYKTLGPFSAIGDHLQTLARQETCFLCRRNGCLVRLHVNNVDSKVCNTATGSQEIRYADVVDRFLQKHTRKWTSAKTAPCTTRGRLSYCTASAIKFTILPQTK